MYLSVYHSNNNRRNVLKWRQAENDAFMTVAIYSLAEGKNPLLG